MYDRLEITTKRVIFRVKSPVPLGDLGKAIQAARVDCAKAKGIALDQLFDDSVMVTVFDQDIHVYYEVEVKE